MPLDTGSDTRVGVSMVVLAGIVKLAEKNTSVRRGYVKRRDKVTKPEKLQDVACIWITESRIGMKVARRWDTRLCVNSSPNGSLSRRT